MHILYVPFSIQPEKRLTGLVRIDSSMIVKLQMTWFCVTTAYLEPDEGSVLYVEVDAAMAWGQSIQHCINEIWPNDQRRMCYAHLEG